MSNMSNTVDFAESINQEHGVLRLRHPRHLTATSGGSHGRYHSALLLVFLLGTFGASLAIIPVLVGPSFQPIAFANTVTNFTSVFGGIFALSVTLCSIYLLLRKKKYIEKGYARFPRNTAFCTSGTEEDPESLLADESTQLISRSRFREMFRNTHLVQILVFGVGGTLYLIIELIRTAYCKRVGELNEPMTFGEIAATTDEIIYLISLGTQMLFFIGYEGVILQNSALFHYAIALMIADKVWVWVSLTLAGVGNITQDPKNSFTTPNTTSISTLRMVLETSQSFLEPFFIEFLTICVGILLGIWNTMGKDTDNRRHSELESQIDENLRFQNCYRRNCSSMISDAHDHRAFSDITESERDWLDGYERNVGTIYGKRMIKLSCIIISVLLLICYSFAGFAFNIGPLQYISDEVDMKNKVYILYGIKIAIYGPLTICCVISARKIYNTTISSPAAMSSSDILLLVTTAGCFLWFLLRIISAIAVIDVNYRYNKSIASACYVLAFCVICIIQVWVQTQLLLSAHSVHRLGYSISKFTKYCLMFLAVVNASEWLQVALERETIIHQKSHFTPVLSEVFGDVTTRIVIYLLYPMTEIYRFHTAVMVYEILI